MNGVIFTDDKEEFRTMVLDKFISDEYNNNSDYAKLIAWRNITVMKSNRTIRLAMFGSDEKCVMVGDVLMGYRSIMDNTNKYNIVENSADYRVIKSSDLDKNKYGIWGYNVKLGESLGNGKYDCFDVFIINSRDHKNLHYYAEMHDNLRDEAKANKKLWKNYYTFRRENIILVTINKHRNGENRINSDVIIKDMDYGFAITGHKSQGSTYTHCFLLEDDLYENHLIKERNQISYVAMTRPTTTCTVLSSKTIL